MSLITCTEDCAYQHDGYCHLDTATAPGGGGGKGCVYYKKSSPLDVPVSDVQGAEKVGKQSAILHEQENP